MMMAPEDRRSEVKGEERVRGRGEARRSIERRGKVR